MQLILCVLLMTCVQMVSSVGTAQISAVVMDPNSMVPFNSSYYFGIYGRKSLRIPVTGHLVHVRSEGNINDGCTNYNHDLPNHDWVALIERGMCDFDDKIRVAAKQNNASAIIVYDNEQTGPNLITMESNVKDEVYLFVKQSFGRRLALLTDSGLHVHVNITPLDLSSSVPPVTTTFSVPLMMVSFWTLVLCTAMFWM